VTEFKASGSSHVGKYYQTIKRMDDEYQTRVRPEHSTMDNLFAQPAASSRALVRLPSVGQVLGEVTRSDAIRAISERLAPLAVVERNMRLAVAACRPGDGASTVAVALALDLSQRMSLRTILVDAHLRRPGVHRLVSFHQAKMPELLLDGSLQIRGSGWSRLEVATCSVAESERRPTEVLAQFEELLAHYQAAVIDLGVPRLDARMLPLARPTDPIMLVVRYGSTERRELSNSAAALRAAHRTVAGVVLNAKTDPVPLTVRRLFNT
jgi:Mrp family chromosome partitioning ATPase